MTAAIRLRVPARGCPRRTPAGSSIVELVVTVGLLLTVSGAILATFISVQRSESYVRGRVTSLAELRIATDTMTRDLRQASVVAPGSGPSQVTFSTFVRGEPSEVRFDVTEGVLTRTVDGGPATVLSADLDSDVVFDYLPSVAMPEVVVISLVVRPPDAPETTIEVGSEVRLRNRG